MISLLSYAVFCTFLVIYSYGFLDFNLTLSSHPLFLKFVEPLQRLVYFERPHSAQAYIFIFASLFVLYVFILFYSRIKYFPWKLFLILMVLLTLAYPMLSYDVFNYMFHGKILWLYHANPHTHAPLEFQNDLWLRFMRWVHTPSAYGPIFTLIESPAYLLGFGKFVPTLYLMKATMTAFFVWIIYLVGQLRGLRAQLLVAFNPFLLLELAVNSHNDAVMIAYAIFALVLWQQKRNGLSVISLLLSIGVKFVTILSLPMFLLTNFKSQVRLLSIFLYLPVLLLPARFQSWYLVWSLLPASLIDTSWSRAWLILTSFAGLVYYLPYVATGFWNNSISFVSFILYLPPLLTLGIYYFHSKTKPSL